MPTELKFEKSNYNSSKWGFTFSFTANQMNILEAADEDLEIKD